MNNEEKIKQLREELARVRAVSIKRDHEIKKLKGEKKEIKKLKAEIKKLQAPKPHAFNKELNKNLKLLSKGLEDVGRFSQKVIIALGNSKMPEYLDES